MFAEISVSDTLTKKPWISRDESLFREFIRHVDLSKVSSDVKVQKFFATQLHDLITDNQGSLRYATSHMLDRRVFLIEDGYPVMTAAKNLGSAGSPPPRASCSRLTRFSLAEETVARLNLTIADDMFHIMCVEELVRLDRQYKSKWLSENEAIVCTQRVDASASHFSLIYARFYI